MRNDTGAAFLVFGSVTATAQTANENDDNYMRQVYASMNLSAYDCGAAKFVRR